MSQRSNDYDDTYNKTSRFGTSKMSVSQQAINTSVGKPLIMEKLESYSRTGVNFDHEKALDKMRGTNTSQMFEKALRRTSCQRDFKVGGLNQNDNFMRVKNLVNGDIETSVQNSTNYCHF